MFCKQCGTEISEGTKFCPNCGAEIKPEQEQKAPEPTAEQKQAQTSVTEEGSWSVLAIVSFAIAAACVLGYMAGGFLMHAVTLICR